MKSGVSLALVSVAWFIALPAYASTRDVMAYCQTTTTNIITNIAPASVPSDITPQNSENWISRVRTVIANSAWETMKAQGATYQDTVVCHFTDPSQPYAGDNYDPAKFEYIYNDLLDHIRSRFRVVQVARLDSESSRQASMSTPATRPAKRTPIQPKEQLPAAIDSPRPLTPNQLKYQRELAAHQERLAEIERIKTETAAKLARDKAAAQEVIDRHRQEMDVNRQQVAAADRAKRQYEQDLAAHEALSKQMRTKQDRDALVDWLEAVTVCELNAQNPQAKFGNWRCEGPLQMDYAKLGSGGQVDPKALFNVSNACGGKVESVRDLGIVSGYRVFGCSYGMHPNLAQRLSNDAAAKFGLAYIPGRITYRCPKWQSGCRVR